jgi:hypothetical protein
VPVLVAGMLAQGQLALSTKMPSHCYVAVPIERCAVWSIYRRTWLSLSRSTPPTLRRIGSPRPSRSRDYLSNAQKRVLMHIQRALIADAERPFVVVAVPPPVIADHTQAEQTIRFLHAHVAELPIALITRDAQGAPTAYNGPRDLAVRLLQLPPAALCWGTLPLS